MKTKSPISQLSSRHCSFLAPFAVASEISPGKVQANSFARFTIEVPTERKVPTVKLEVKLPTGVTDVTGGDEAWLEEHESGRSRHVVGGQDPTGPFRQVRVHGTRAGRARRGARLPSAPDLRARELVSAGSSGRGSDTPAPRVTVAQERRGEAPTATVTLDEAWRHEHR